ncbi:unnamed protein product [Boreogadus saida]
MTSNSPQHRQPSLRALLQDDSISEEQGFSAAVVTLDTKQELKEILVEKCDGALTPLCGETKDCNTDHEAFSNSIEIRASAANILPIRSQLLYLMGRADDLQNQLAHTQDQLERGHLSTLVSTLLSSSWPLFTYLESRARSRLTQQPAGPPPTTSSSTFLDLSQQLCERLEQLVQNYVKQGLLSVDESQSDSLSDLYLGQCVIDRLKVSLFRYHAPAPFMSGGRAHPSLFKRMRWNVERLSDDRLHPHHHLYHHHRPHQQQGAEPEERQLETGADTEYFLMCYEEIPQRVSGEEEGGLPPGASATRGWSIGRWVQTFPDPDTGDIYDWILCEVPQTRYLKLVTLGSEEPSVRHATDLLLGLLFPQQIGGKDDFPCSES